MSYKSVITDYFSHTASRFPDKVCVQVEKDGVWQRYTYSQAESFSKQIAAFLASNSIGKGDFVLLTLDNCPEWAFFYLGILYAGACAVPLDPQARILEVEKITSDCNPKAVVLSRRTYSEKDFTRIKSKFKKIVITDLSFVPVADDNVTCFQRIKDMSVSKGMELPDNDPDDPASLIYTSGTTGAAKGVVSTHNNFCFNVESMRKLKMCTTDDTGLCILPLFHSYAFMGGLLAPLLIGATVTFCQSLKSEDVLRTINEAGVTFMGAVPEFFKILRNKIFAKYYKSPALFKPFVLSITKSKVRQMLGDSLRLFVSGGARLDPVVAKDIARLGIEMNEGYGLTETSPIVTINPSDKIKHGSSGKPLPGVEIKISDPNESGVGEILIKGPNVMKGYYNQPQLTAEVIRDGWFHSGDLGYLDKDGYLYITGRLKEMIVLSSGKNIYPEEVEEVYLASDFIKEICVVTTPKQPGLHAVIYPDMTNLQKAGIVNIRPQIKWELESISKQLAAYKRVMGFTVVKEPLPKTRLGKVKRFQVVRQIAEVPSRGKPGITEYSDEDKLLLETDSSKEVMEFLRHKFKRDIFPDDSLELDLGIDSLGRIELVDNLECTLNINIPDDIISNVFTIRQLLEKLSELAEAVPADRAKQAFDWKELLFKLPSEELASGTCINPSLLNRFAAITLKKVIYCLLKIFWRLKVSGRENLPRKGPYILCPNHASFLDPFILLAGLPDRVVTLTFFQGYSGIFKRPFFQSITRFARIVPIDPNANFSQALQMSSFILRSAKVMCVFPEGGRSINDNIQPFKKGVAILARELNVPVVPVLIKGSGKAWPRAVRLPRLHPVKIIYGKPLTASSLLQQADKTSGDNYQKIADSLREKVATLNGVQLNS